MRLSKSIARWSAKLESHLSTYAFSHIFLFFYAAAVFLMFIWGAVGEWRFQVDQNSPTLMRWLISIARGAGYSLNLNCAFVILLAARLFFTWLRDTPLNLILPLDKAFPLIHIIVGYTIAISVVVHAAFHLGWIITFNQWEGGLWGFTMSAVTGFALFTIFAVMLVFAHPKIRAKHFRAFYIVHLVGAFLFFVLLIFHGMFRRDPETYKYITPPLIIYIVDRILRRLKISSSTLELSAANSIFKDDKILELRVPKPFNYKSGQYAEIMVPSINKEWHPFTIASASHEDTMVFYIKNLGDWTNALHEAFQQRIDGIVTDSLRVRVRGPYGAPAQHVGAYERVVLISGGIGATPFSAICKELHALNEAKDSDTTPEQKGGLSRAEARVDKAISQLYDVDTSIKGPANETAQQRSIYVSDMLRITATNLQRRELSNVQGNQEHEHTRADRDAELDSVMIDVNDDDNLSFSSISGTSTAGSYLTAEDGSSAICHIVDGRTSTKKARNPASSNFETRKCARRNRFDRRARLLAFLHTTRFYFALLVTLIIRIVILCFGSILKSPFMTIAEDSGESVGRWCIIADAILSFLFVAVLPLTVLLEVSFMGTRFFNSFRRCLDFIAFFPLTILYTALSLRTAIMNDPESSILVLVHYVVFVPLIFILLAIRMYRSIGSRNFLSNRECRCQRHGKVPDVDFVWTTPNDGDDEWLRRELEPLADETDLRLHRFVTRAKEADLETGDAYITTQTGRPDWEAVFSDVARASKSGSVVGVFFCGPHAMGDAVRSAMRRVEITSNLRGAYLNGMDDSALTEDIGVRKEELRRLKDVGCSVRFVFREENFG